MKVCDCSIQIGYTNMSAPTCKNLAIAGSIRHLRLYMQIPLALTLFSVAMVTFFELVSKLDKDELFWDP